MINKVFLMILLFCWAASGAAADRTYKVTVMYEADDQGKVLTQKPYNGTVILKDDGAYSVQVYQNDEGKYRFAKATAGQPNDTIYFFSNKNFRYFAYPKGNMIAVWLNKPRPGVNLWVNAFLSDGTAATPAPPAGTPSQPAHTGGLYSQGLIKNGRFTKVVMFSSTSAGSYFYYDENTGDFSHDQTGMIFWPNGGYFLKAEFGSMETKERGTYTINGKKVTLRFSDGSFITFDIAPNGRDINYYSQGMLINEFFFLGAK